MAISFPQIGLEATSTVPRVALRPDLGFMSAASVMHSVPCEPAQQDGGDSVILRYSSRRLVARCRVQGWNLPQTVRSENDKVCGSSTLLAIRNPRRGDDVAGDMVHAIAGRPMESRVIYPYKRHAVR